MTEGVDLSERGKRRTDGVNWGGEEGESARMLCTKKRIDIDTPYGADLLSDSVAQLAQFSHHVMDRDGGCERGGWMDGWTEA